MAVRRDLAGFALLAVFLCQLFRFSLQSSGPVENDQSVSGQVFGEGVAVEQPVVIRHRFGIRVGQQGAQFFLKPRDGGRRSW